MARAQETAAALQEQLAELEAAFKAEALGGRADPQADPLETVRLRATRQNVSVRLVTLAWAPYWRDGGGDTNPAWS